MEVLSNMETLLFAPETFNLAETTRMIEVAKECQAQFNCVFMGYSRKFSELIEEAGFPFLLLEPELTEKDVLNIMKFDQMKSVKFPLSYEQLKIRIESELKLMEVINPKGIIIGSTMSLLISARVKQIPIVYVKPYAYTRAHIESPQFMQDSDRMIRGFVKAILLHVRWFPKIIRRLINDYRLNEQFKYTIDFMDADFNCLTTPEILTKNATLPPDNVYVGPIFARLKKEIPAEILQLLSVSQEPILFCSMGSSANKKIILQLLHVFEGMSVQVISPMKSYLTEKEIEKLPTNVHIFDWLPAQEVQALVAASVLHGGEGSLQTACVSGKPFIGIGLQMEQEYNISCCVDYGNAISIKKHQLKNYSYVRKQIQRLLTDAELKHKAVNLQKNLQQLHGAKIAAKEIINFLENVTRV